MSRAPVARLLTLRAPVARLLTPRAPATEAPARRADARPVISRRRSLRGRGVITTGVPIRRKLLAVLNRASQGVRSVLPTPVLPRLQRVSCRLLAGARLRAATLAPGMSRAPAPPPRLLMFEPPAPGTPARQADARPAWRWAPVAIARQRGSITPRRNRRRSSRRRGMITITGVPIRRKLVAAPNIAGGGARSVLPPPVQTSPRCEVQRGHVMPSLKLMPRGRKVQGQAERKLRQCLIAPRIPGLRRQRRAGNSETMPRRRRCRL